MLQREIKFTTGHRGLKQAAQFLEYAHNHNVNVGNLIIKNDNNYSFIVDNSELKRITCYAEADDYRSVGLSASELINQLI